MIKRYESVFKESPRVDDELLDLMMQFINENSANPNSDNISFQRWCNREAYGIYR